MIRAMSTELWLDFLGIRLDSKKAEGMKFIINLVTPDNDEKYVVEMSNSVLTNIKGVQAKKPDLTITINRTDLEQAMAGKVTFDDQIKAGKAKLVGDRKPYERSRVFLSSSRRILRFCPARRPSLPCRSSHPSSRIRLLGRMGVDAPALRVWSACHYDETRRDAEPIARV